MKPIIFLPFFLAVCVFLSFNSCRINPVNNGGSDSIHNGSDTTNSGITNAQIVGVVRKGPVAPVEQIGVDNTAPLTGATITIAGPNGFTVTAVSDTSGTFDVNVASGTYTLTPLPFPNSMFPRPPAAITIQVAANTSDTARFEYDTGIR